MGSVNSFASVEYQNQETIKIHAQLKSKVKRNHDQKLYITQPVNVRNTKKCPNSNKIR